MATERNGSDHKNANGKNANGKNGNGHHEHNAENNGNTNQQSNQQSNEEQYVGMAHMPTPEKVEGYQSVPVTIKSLMEAGAHFGHKTDRWNPKMLPFIFGQKNGVHVINLDITMKSWEKARKFVVDITSRGGTVLMVGTKPQAKNIIQRAAKRAGAFYIHNRWLGGMLSNFNTIKNSLRRMRKLEELLEQADQPGSEIKIVKKERLSIRRQVDKLAANLGGIREMRKHPDVIFLVDVNKEAIAIAEARKLHIPIIALVDTNVDPNLVNIGIPANDDANRTIELFANGIADAILEGRTAYESRVASDQKQRAEQKAANRAKANAAKAEREAAVATETAPAT
jgi:small subunit ribosomal protein S2